MNGMLAWRQVAFVAVAAALFAASAGGAIGADADGTPATPGAGVEERGSVPLDHVGALVVGDAFDARSPASTPWRVQGVNEETNCFHVTEGDLPDGIAMMVMDGRIARFQLGPEVGSARGPFGLHPGMRRAAAEEAMPKNTRVSQHQYGGEGDVYIDWFPPGGRMGVRAEILSGRVSDVSWGDGVAVQLIEGCS